MHPAVRRAPCPVAVLLALTACSSGTTTGSPTPPATFVSVTPSSPPAEATATATVRPTATTTPTATPTTTATATSTPLESAPPPGAPTCKPANLTVTDADTVVTQQAREQVYVLRTNGPDCGLDGYPTVTLRGTDGKALAVTYSHGPGPATPLSLSKGTSVSFSVTSPRAGTCVDAATIRVLLPGTGSALQAATTARICQARASVSPVRRLNADG